jgi:hypothetical protein
MEFCAGREGKVYEDMFDAGRGSGGLFWLLVGNTAILAAIFITRSVDIDEPSVQSLRKTCPHPSLTAA